MIRGVAALVLAAGPAVAADAVAFAVPGAGTVPQDDMVALLSNFIADQGCTLDLTDSAGTTEAATAFVAAELGLPGDARTAALPAIGAAIEQTFDAMVAQGVLTTDPDTRTAGLIECEP